MNPEKAIVHLLENDGTVAASLGTRIYPGYAPQDAAFPFAIFGRESTDPDHHMLGASGLRLVRIGITFFGPQALSLGALAEAAEAALDSVNDRTTVQGINIARLWLDDMSQSQIELADGTGRPIHAVSQTYSMHYQEA